MPSQTSDISNRPDEPSRSEVMSFLDSLEKDSPFAGHEDEFKLLKHLVELHYTGEIRAGKYKVIRVFRRTHMDAPSLKSQKSGVSWKDSNERALYRKLKNIIDTVNSGTE